MIEKSQLTMDNVEDGDIGEAMKDGFKDSIPSENVSSTDPDGPMEQDIGIQQESSRTSQPSPEPPEPPAPSQSTIERLSSIKDRLAAISTKHAKRKTSQQSLTNPNSADAESMSVRSMSPGPHYLNDLDEMEAFNFDEYGPASADPESITTAPEADPTCACFIVIDPDEPSKCRSCNGFFKPVLQLEQKRNKARLTLNEIERKMKEALARDEATAKETSRLMVRVEELEVLMDAKAEELARLQRDMQYMGEKVVDEIDKRAELQVSRDALHEELEELTKTLFEEANVLVADEARKRHFHENREKSLEQDLANLKLQLQMEQLQLRELQIKMEESKAKEGRRQLQTAKSGDSSKKAPGSPSSSSQLRTNTNQDTPLNAAEPSFDTIDPVLLAEFEDFLKQAPSVKLNKLINIPFMKNAMEDDIAPCLRFGSSPRTSTRRLVDAIVQNSCFVEEMSNTQRAAMEAQYLAFKDFADAQQAIKAGVPIPPRKSPATSAETEKVIISMLAAPTQTIFQKTVLERFSTWTLSSSSSAGSTLPSSVVLNGCSTCGRIGPTKHHFKISEQKDDCWCPVCQQCRDRLVATCDFYNFVRHIRQGLYSTRRKEDMYIEVLALKRKMFFARIGAANHVKAERSFTGAGLSLLRPDSQLLNLVSSLPKSSGSPGLSRRMLGGEGASSSSSVNTASSSSAATSNVILPPPPAALR
ncbi:RAB3A interacting protein [Chytridiales sp. JEL 0842]|nr:RAB3A interacting protein [Chytridiales sp. JEL 0842]